jgi:hypothetical protein
VMSSTERKAMRQASLKNCEGCYFQLIQAQPDSQPQRELA